MYHFITYRFIALKKRIHGLLMSVIKNLFFEIFTYRKEKS